MSVSNYTLLVFVITLIQNTLLNFFAIVNTSVQQIQSISQE